MFHVNDKDEAKVCRAKEPQKCRFYRSEDDSRHYDNVADAQSFIEKKLAHEHGTLTKKNKYSFVKEFAKQEKEFYHDFDGIPNRFFHTDLRDKYAPVDADYEDLKTGERFLSVNGINNKLIMSVSQPNDNKISDDKTLELLTNEGFSNIVKIDSDVIVRGLKSNRAWLAKLEDKDVIIIDGNAGTNALTSRYAFRNDNKYIKAQQYFHKIDLRRIAGNARVKKKIGIDLMKDSFRVESSLNRKNEFDNSSVSIKRVFDSVDMTDEQRIHALQDISRNRYSYYKMNTVNALQRLEDAQLEGKNFLAQKKYIKEHSGKIATVWEDKKNTDDVHKDLMKNSTVKDLFRKIDLDNDVDPSEYKKFEEDINDMRDKLPSIPKGLEPELRLRKLGKHSSKSNTVSGLYNPAKNALGISVTDSSSYVHEMMHYLDLTVKNNASLSRDFREISKDYSKNLKVPVGVSPDYYAVPSEQLARCGEIWASEKLGIDNRLIDKDRFKKFDYAPIMENPVLKKKVFVFFDKLFENDIKE